ncbi:unnamed protein product [Sphagnum balticum]
MILGPSQSPYEGFELCWSFFYQKSIQWQRQRCVGIVRFLTKIYHPNIDKFFRSTSITTGSVVSLRTQLGRICLDILKDKWSPALHI